LAHARSARTRAGAGRSARGILTALGPGLITGASDDDPSGIATYSQVGARFGFAMLWTLLFSYPLMAAIQEICARIGRVTGHGIAGNMRRHHPRALLYPVVGLMVVANVINLGADLGGMGAAVSLLIGGRAEIHAAVLAAVSLLLQVLLPYSKYVNVLKWLTLALFAYVATVFAVHVPWAEALRATVLPAVHFGRDYLTGLIAVLGTTISPYLFFWQASAEAEEEEDAPGEQPLRRAPGQAREQLHRIRLDTYVGMAFSNLVAFFIMLTTAATLHAHGVTNIGTAAQAAEALRPLAGRFGSLLFSAGIVGTGLLAIPVLAGSAAYAIGETLGWPTGLERKPHEAKAFYGVLALATALGLGMILLHFDPIRALFWSAVINGVLAGPLMIVILVMSADRGVMGRFTVPRGLRVMGWLAAIVMLLAAAGALFA
jgi:NRAMP (natural resistance-associated macrophage protein)-like metal ion transporter